MKAQGRLHGLSALFTDTLRKEYRSKTLLSLLIFTVLVVFASKGILDFFKWMGSEQGEGNILAQGVGFLSLNIFYAFIDMWSVLVATLIGVNTLHSDEDHKVANQLLSFPIERNTYLLSRLLGSWFIVTCYYLFSLLLASALFSLSSEKFLLDAQFILALINSSLMVFSSLIFAMGFSLLLPRFMALIANLMFIAFISGINGYVSSDEFPSLWSQMSGFDWASFGLSWIFPRYATITSHTTQVLFGSESLSIDYALNFGHFLIFALLWAWIFSRIFKKRDL